MTKESYIITQTRGTAIDVFSISVGDGDPTILIFEDEDDAERYVIMLEEDDSYVVGETIHLKVTEIPMKDSIEVFDAKGHNYIIVKKDDLFIPPPT